VEKIRYFERSVIAKSLIILMQQQKQWKRVFY